MKYKRIDLLNLAWEMGVQIKSDKDLIDFECDMILIGTVDPANRIDDPIAPVKTEKSNEPELDIAMMIRDIHKALFDISSNPNKSKEEAIAKTKARLILSMNKKRKNNL